MNRALLFLATLPLVAADGGLSLGIFLDFPKAPATHAVNEMKEEVRALLQARRFNLQWRALKENQGNESFDRLVVVKFKGRCAAQPAANLLDDAAPFQKSVTVASTSVSNGRVLPYSEVDCDRLRGTLGSRVSAFGRALGVVVAHELQHILENTVRHAKAGFMKRAIDWKDLAPRKKGQAFPAP
jgi:hypothetical protein